MINYITKSKKKFDCTKNGVRIKNEIKPIIKDVNNNTSVNISVKTIFG